MTIQTKTMPRRLGALLLCLALLVGLLPMSALAADTGAFTVSGDSNSYSYNNGVLTVNNGANITISMASGATAPTSDRIVVAENATATITLAGVNIKGSDCDGAQVIAAKSAIDLSNGSILTIDLSANTENTLTGGSGSTEGSGAPGIHVPDSASLIIQGEGSLSVSGGTSSTAFSGVGIGGNASTTSAGEACGTVICFASGNVTITAGTQGSGSVPADNIGGGNGQNQNNGDDGQGIRPGTDGTYTVYGDLELPCDITIPAGAKVVIPEGASLTVPQGTTLTNEGTILVQGGTFTNNGTVSGNQPTYPSTVTVSFSQNGEAVTSVPYGSTVTITATMAMAETATNALEVDPGMVGFYLGEDIQYGILVGTDDVEIVDGVYTASVDVTIGQDKGFNNVGTFKFTADFGGYAPDGDESGDSLAPNTGSAQLTVVASYSIDYEEETITIAEGFSLYEAETEGNAIFTSNGENNTISLTEYIQSTNKTLYLQAPSAGADEQPDRREITIPARPQALTITPTINYEEEKLSFSPDITATTLEYALSQPDSDWKDVPSSAALSEMGWTGNQMTVYFRTGATESAFASAATQSPLNIPARPAAPNGLNLMDWTDVSVTYYVGEGVQCRLGNEGAWVTLEQNKTNHTFNNLTPQTTYTIYARKPATESQFASAEASDEVTTKSSAAEPPAMTYEVTANSITLSYSAPWQYQTSDDEWISVEGSKEFTSLEAATEYTFTVRVAESETAEASKVGTVTAWTAYATPTGVQGGVNQITGVTTALEYSNDGGKTWTACQDTTVTGLAAGEYLVRHKAGENIPASAAVTVTVTQYTPPYIPAKPDGPSTGDSDGWKDIQDEIADAEDGDTITIDMGDETEVPGEIFEEVAGKDVTVEIELDGGVTWTVNGEDIPTGTDFSDLNLGVKMGTSGISVDVINTVTGELGSVQITLAHDGEFGFALTLTAPLGKENAGYWANLYHYNEDAQALNYETSAQIDDKGDVSLPMTHASQYAIVIDSKSHDLPFTDVVTGSWYESAVRYAYTHGIMEGTSATTFVPGKSLTRAEAVQVLYNLEGQPTVSGSTTFPDLVYEWYKPAIAWEEQTGVVDGYEDGTFRPDQPVNRMEFAQMLYNYAACKGCDLTAQGDLTQFPDGDSVQEWAEPAMTWANGNELINGHDDGTLEPGGTTTRAQAASILMRFDQKLVE